MPSCQRAMRDRAGEAGDVDAVGDDLVVAREEAVDEVAGRRADRDPAVEPGGVAAHDPAAELVRRREAGVGVEGRHVDARRLAQQEQRQERHERLVEVEQVEPLAGQHRADLADVARRERQRADRAVGRHREADPDADDVALRRALRTVAGGDDPHVVAAQAQVLVEEPDVLGDPAGLRVDVRADEADLHGRPRRVLAGRSAAAAAGRPGSRGRDRSRRAGSGRPPRRARRDRACAAAGRRRPSCPSVPWNVPWCSVGAPAIAVPQVGRASAREASSSPSRWPSRAWASLLPTWARPCRSANCTTRACQGRPSAVGLNVSMASGWTALVRIVEQAAQDPALGAQRIGHERMGRDRQAARRRGPPRSFAQRPIRPDPAARCPARAGGRRGS